MALPGPSSTPLPGYVPATSQLPAGMQTDSASQWSYDVATTLATNLYNTYVGTGQIGGMPASWSYGPITPSDFKGGGVTTALWTKLQTFANSQQAASDADLAAFMGRPKPAPSPNDWVPSAETTAAALTAAQYGLNVRQQDFAEAKFAIQLAVEQQAASAQQFGSRASSGGQQARAASYSGGGGSSASNDPGYAERLQYERDANALNLSFTAAKQQMELDYLQKKYSLDDVQQQAEMALKQAQLDLQRQGLTQDQSQFESSLAFQRETLAAQQAKDAKAEQLARAKTISDYAANPGDAVAREYFLRQQGAEPLGTPVDIFTGQAGGQQKTFSQLMTDQAPALAPYAQAGVSGAPPPTTAPVPVPPPQTPPETPQYARGTDPNITPDGWTRAPRFISGDPQRPGQPNPEMIQLRNGQDGRPEAKVTPISQMLRGAPMYAQGTTTAATTTRRRGANLQYDESVGSAQQQAPVQPVAQPTTPVAQPQPAAQSQPEPAPIPTPASTATPQQQMPISQVLAGPNASAGTNTSTPQSTGLPPGATPVNSQAAPTTPVPAGFNSWRDYAIHNASTYTYTDEFGQIQNYNPGAPLGTMYRGSLQQQRIDPYAGWVVGQPIPNQPGTQSSPATQMQFNTQAELDAYIENLIAQEYAHEQSAKRRHQTNVNRTMTGSEAWAQTAQDMAANTAGMPVVQKGTDGAWGNYSASGEYLGEAELTDPQLQAGVTQSSNPNGAGYKPPEGFPTTGPNGEPITYGPTSKRISDNAGGLMENPNYRDPMAQPEPPVAPAGPGVPPVAPAPQVAGYWGATPLQPGRNDVVSDQAIPVDQISVDLKNISLFDAATQTWRNPVPGEVIPAGTAVSVNMPETAAAATNGGPDGFQTINDDGTVRDASGNVIGDAPGKMGTGAGPTAITAPATVKTSDGYGTITLKGDGSEFKGPDGRYFRWNSVSQRYEPITSANGLVPTVIATEQQFRALPKPLQDKILSGQPVEGVVLADTGIDTRAMAPEMAASMGLQPGQVYPGGWVRNLFMGQTAGLMPYSKEEFMALPPEQQKALIEGTSTDPRQYQSYADSAGSTPKFSQILGAGMQQTGFQVPSQIGAEAFDYASYLDQQQYNGIYYPQGSSPEQSYIAQPRVNTLEPGLLSRLIKNRTEDPTKQFIPGPPEPAPATPPAAPPPAAPPPAAPPPAAPPPAAPGAGGSDVPTPPATGGGGGTPSISDILNGNPSALSYGAEAYANLPGMQFLKGIIDEGQYDSISSAPIEVPALGLVGAKALPAPNSLNATQLAFMQQNNPDGFALLNALYTAAGKPLTSFMPQIQQAAPAGQVFESSLISTV